MGFKIDTMMTYLILLVVLLIATMEVGIMSQLDDLKAAIADEDVEIGDLGTVITKVDTDLAALAAAVAAGATPTVLTTQIAAIQAHTAALVTGIGQLTAADTAAVPPAPTTPPAAS